MSKGKAPVTMENERSILDLPRIHINGGKRGYLVGIDPRTVAQLLQARPVEVGVTERVRGGDIGYT